jgi:glycine/D-amino acid oxidase-like deaminating enzyme
MKTPKVYDAIIIGGGFYGLSISIYLTQVLGLKKVLVVEKDQDYMQRASYNNQARIHNGYHYPRSLLTGIRSRINLPIFVEDYPEAVVNNFDKYYAVARMFSKISAKQFYIFSERIGSEINQAPSEIKSLFDKNLIEDVFRVKEYAFDARILKESLLKKVEQLPIDLMLGEEVIGICENKKSESLYVDFGGERMMYAKRVFNCTYSMINTINIQSNLPIVPLKHELVEMCLVELPEEIKDISVTVMDGPFFSFMPFPDRMLTTLSHVRYTPHSEWKDDDFSVRNGHYYLENEITKISHFEQMKADVKRYMPIFDKVEYKDSLWEVKTVLPKSEGDDSRPILYKSDYGIRGYTVIMGGKIDNIYDVYKELDMMYGKA